MNRSPKKYAENLCSAIPAEPIAVIGLGCKLPGSVESLEEGWTVFAESRNAYQCFTQSRHADQFRRPWETHRAFDFTSGACLLNQIDLFDNGLFNISPRETHHIYPQQRLLLMTTWRVLEDACTASHSLLGLEVGVFVETSGNDYSALLRTSQAAEYIDTYSGTGTHASNERRADSTCIWFDGSYFTNRYGVLRFTSGNSHRLPFSYERKSKPIWLRMPK